MSNSNTKPISAFNGLWTVFKKEVIDNLRDKRTLTTMAASIILTPLLMIGFLWFAEKTVEKETDPVTSESFELPVVGAEYAPNLMEWLRQNNVEILDAPEDAEAEIRSGSRRVVLVIERDYPELFTAGVTAPVKLIHDSSVSGLEQLGRRTVERALHSYSKQVGTLRLQARGISPEIVNAIQVNLSDVATPEARGANIVNMLPYLIIMFIMAGGMYLAIDTTAGEREKGSLESLLTLPASRSHILLAKMLATAFFSALTFAFVLIGLAVSIANAPVDSINMSITPEKVIYLFFTCLPFVFAASGLLILVASFTKSYKEAQSYLGFIMLLPSMPLLFLAFLSPEASLSNMWVPSLSQALIILETVKGETIDISLILLSGISSLLTAAALCFVAMKLYQRERILG